MKELMELLHEIEKTYNGVLSNDEKYNVVSMLWSKYYQLKHRLGIELDDDYNMTLLYQNDCYKINQEPRLELPNNELVEQSLINLTQAIQNKNGITQNDVHNILDYVVYYTRKNFDSLGININKTSLDGFCELGQSLSLRPLEQLGLLVTKNLSESDFDYAGHHAFGTVTFPVMENDTIINKTYLIDTTYRQFFSSIKCHEGMYYIKADDTFLYKKPAPGYFVHNEGFARELMREGYIELTLENAYLYGIPFALSGYGDATRIDYYNNILNDKHDYVLSENELDGLKVSFPAYNNKYRI